MTTPRPGHEDSHQRSRGAEKQRRREARDVACAGSEVLAELRQRTTCSVDEASLLLGIGRSTAYAAAHDGSLPTVRLSHRILVPTAKLFAMIGAEPNEPVPQSFDAKKVLTDSGPVARQAATEKRFGPHR